MNLNKIQNLVKINTAPSRWLRAIKYYNRKLVDYVTFNIDSSVLTFDGMVESEFVNEVYPNSISIDIRNYKIVKTSCTCEDFRSKNSTSNFFICKHVASTAIAGTHSLKEDVFDEILNNLEEKKVLETIKATPNASLLSYFDDIKKSELNLEVNIDVSFDKVTADFKIGEDKLYVVKNLKELINARTNNTMLEYGKNFIYNPNTHYFSDIDEELVDIIEEHVNNPSYSSMAFYNTKLMDIGPSGFKRFLKNLSHKDFSLHYKKEVYYPKVIDGPLPVEFDLRKDDTNISLNSKSDLPVPLTVKGDVVLYENNLYLLSSENARSYSKVYNILNDSSNISFSNEETERVLTNLVPRLKTFSSKVALDEEIENNIINDFNPEFYFDFKNSNVICDLKFVYDKENTSKFILRNLEKEKIFEDKLISLKFKKDGNTYVFRGDDYDLFNFLDLEIMHLKDLGDVYYSDKFKARKIYKSNSILANIKDTQDGYLDFSFNISDLDNKEFKNIVLEFKKNSKFYKLKNGSFVDLQEDKTKDFLQLIDNLDLVNSKDNRVNINKTMYIKDIIENKNLNFIDGKETLNELNNKFKNIDSIDLSIPKSLNATLRDYQISGLTYFKTLDFYGFGGILADEMGLGKTLQAIAFLLSKKESYENIKSLIVTPTALLYNWNSEFEKFAPSLKILLVHGNKKERDSLISSYTDYDVIITTYATLRNDIENYENIKFDYCIIDEAQNIKNPIAQSTQAVKSVDAKMKMALTGTPIENNLFELWSIFDFIMPGYLYSRNKFQDLFIFDEYNKNNLKKLIQPFILRRTKKEVMKELPDKIENKFFVKLNKEQRKVYSAYVHEIREKMNNKNIKTDKITMFSYLTKLRQLCLDPSVLIEDYNKKSSKIETVLELVQDYIEDNHKILLFSQFTSVLKNIGAKFDKNNIPYYYMDGQTDAKSRLNLVNEFNANEDIKVFLISLKAGGTGLNLTSADIVIHFDPWWNPSVENQASDRAHRYGQENVVQVIKLIAKGTIEEKIVKLQENKNELINTFINGELSDSNLLKNLSQDDIIELFS